MEWARELTSAILLTANMMLFFLLLYCSDGFIVVFALCSVCNRLSWHSSMILISISFWFGMTEALNDGKTVWILKNAIRRQRRALKFLSQAFFFFLFAFANSTTRSKSHNNVLVLAFGFSQFDIKIASSQKIAALRDDEKVDFPLPFAPSSPFKIESTRLLLSDDC